ncbi:MAG TPA: glycosyltransferase [Methanolinea sp.]|nr:glycosyltransferase [Methanolinea sp.]
MTNNPDISVVIPLFNKGQYISRTIQSVLNQSVQNFEIIVVNGQSTDEGPFSVQSFQDKRIVLIEQKGSGVSSARNEGIYNSKAELIAFLDADDEWMHDHLETLLRLFKNYPHAGGYSTAYLKKTLEGKIHRPNFIGIPKKPWEGILDSYFKSAAFGSSPLLTSAVGVPKSILREMGGFNEKVWLGEDIELWARIAFKYPIAFSWKGIVIYHTEAANRACRRIEPVEEDIVCRTAREAIEYGNVSVTNKEYILEYIAKKQIQSACRNLLAGRPDLAKIILKKCNTNYFKKEKAFAQLWAYLPNSFFQISRYLKIRIESVLPGDSTIITKLFKLA